MMIFSLTLFILKSSIKTVITIFMKLNEKLKKGKLKIAEV